MSSHQGCRMRRQPLPLHHTRRVQLGCTLPPPPSSPSNLPTQVFRNPEYRFIPTLHKYLTLVCDTQPASFMAWNTLPFVGGWADTSPQQQQQHMQAHMHVREQETYQLHAPGGRGEVRVGVRLAAAQPNRRRHGTGLGEDLRGTANNENSPILLPPKPYLVLRDTLCSCEAYGMKPMYKKKKKKRRREDPGQCSENPTWWWEYQAYLAVKRTRY
jgi:hypothetical protein